MTEQTSITLLEDAGYEITLTLKDESGAAVEPSKYDVYGAIENCGAKIPFEVSETGNAGEWLCIIPPQRIKRAVRLPFQLCARRKSCAHEWLVMFGEVQLIPRVAEVAPEKLEAPQMRAESTLSHEAHAVTVEELHGVQGEQGEQGRKGERGFSAYEVAKNNGYQGTEKEWVQELEGAAAAATAAKTAAKNAGDSAAAADTSASNAANEATAAGKSAAAAAESASNANSSATAAQTAADNAATAAKNAGDSAAAADTSASNAANEATAAGKSAAAANTAATAAAKAATNTDTRATDAENAAQRSETALQNAEAAKTAAENAANASEAAADAVKYDLIPVSVDWLQRHFEEEAGMIFDDSANKLTVSFPIDTPQEQRESILTICNRVMPKSATVEEGWLPKGFIELEYLQSNGTQYIDTGVETDGTYTISCRLQVSTTGAVWGRACALPVAEYTGGQSWARLLLTTGKEGLYIFYGWIGAVFSNVESMPPQWDRTQPHDWLAVEGVKSVTLDGSMATLRAMSGGSVNVSNPAQLTHYICAANGGHSTGTGKATMKLYRFTMIDGSGNTVFNGLPTLDTNNAPCLFDTVSKTCFYNIGSGSFGYRVKTTGEDAAAFSLRDPYYTAPSGIYARKVGENELEIIADTEEVHGEGWEQFANTAEAYAHFGIEQDEAAF